MQLYNNPPDRNSTKLSQDAAYQRAARRVHSRMVFRLHVVSYLLGGALLTGIYLLTSTIPGFPTNLWIVWPLLGWSGALILHFVLVFIVKVADAEDKFEKMVRDELRRRG